MGNAPSTVLAHGIGSRQDLPIPFLFVLVGAGLALVLSFVILGLAWREPRFAERGRPLPAWVTSFADSPVLHWALRVFGLLALAYTIMAATFAPDLTTNPTAGLVYVAFWLGLIPASLLFGPVWRIMNPIRTVHLLLAKALGSPPEQAGVRALPAWVGYWPAAVGLFAFAWLELVAPNRATTGVLRAFVLAYVGVHLILTVIFGSRWLDRGDGFEVFSGLLGHLSVLGRGADGQVVLRSPLANLDRVVPGPGLAATVCVLLGSTAYDSLSNAPAWVRWYQSTLGPTRGGSLGLAGAVLIIGILYVVATTLAGRLGGRPPREMPAAFAHSIVPIALGYLVAHYFTLFVLEGQRVLITISDPFSNGSNWFGTANLVVDQWIVSHPTLVATIQVVAIVVGHVCGAVSAHDRAVSIFPPRVATVSQLPLLVLMVVYTVTGLLLLFAT